MKPLLEVNDLKISIFNGKRACKCADSVRFSVQPGEILYIVGKYMI